MPPADLWSEAAVRWGPYLALLALPILLLLATALTKALVVVGALRAALSAQALLPAPLVFAVAALLAALVMAPTAEASWNALVQAGGPVGADLSALMAAIEPWRAFVERHASADEVAFFSDLRGQPAGDPLVDISAFLVTELTEAFQIAVLLAVPMLVVDLVAAQALVLLGMGQMPLGLVSLPLKLALFLAVDGWDLLVQGFVGGYG